MSSNQGSELFKWLFQGISMNLSVQPTTFNTFECIQKGTRYDTLRCPFDLFLSDAGPEDFPISFARFATVRKLLLVGTQPKCLCNLGQ
jgi:hypothetical protein